MLHSLVNVLLRHERQFVKKNSVTFHSVRFFSTSTSSKSTNQRRDGEWLHDSTLTFVIWKERWYFIRKLSHCWFLLICIWYTTVKIEGGHMCKNVVINIQYWLSYEFPRSATCTILNSHPLNLACTVQYLSGGFCAYFNLALSHCYIFFYFYSGIAVVWFSAEKNPLWQTLWLR